MDKVYDQISGHVSSLDADYESVPIEAFGLAVLKGCGWHEGEGIGKTNKRLVGIRYKSFGNFMLLISYLCIETSFFKCRE